MAGDNLMLLWQVWGTDLWELYHKVTFDGPNRLIIVNDDELNIDVKVDIYSDWKEWALQRDYLKFLPACRSVGGDPTVGGNFLGSTFFTINDWRIVVSDSTIFDGNLFSDDFDSPFLAAEGAVVARQQFSNLVDTVGATIDPDDIIAAGLVTSGDLVTQTTNINNFTQTTTDNQTTILQNDLSAISGALPGDVITQLNSTNYDGVPYGDIMSILLSMAQGRIVEQSTGVFEFYSQDNSTILYTLTKSGNERTRS